MGLLFWGLTISMVGKILLAAGVLLAHSEIAHEHRIDDRVIRSFRIERWLTFLGIVLMIVGYGLEIVFYGFTPLLECGLGECGALIQKAISQ